MTGQTSYRGVTCTIISQYNQLTIMARSIISKYIKITLCLPNQQQQECCGDISNKPCFQSRYFQISVQRMHSSFRYGSATKTDPQVYPVRVCNRAEVETIYIYICQYTVSQQNTCVSVLYFSFYLFSCL